MAENQNRGSEWRKWDLHIHSPFTWVNNNYPSNDKDLIIDKFINTVTDSGLDVIGLTNYFKFDNKDFEIKKRLEKKGICTFLNLEVRLSNINKDGQMIDYHIIFDNQLDDSIIKNFLASSKAQTGDSEKAFNQLTKDDIQNKAAINFDNLLEKLCEEGSGLKGHYITGFLSRGHGSATCEPERKTHSVYEEITRKSDLILHSSDKIDNLMRDRKYWLETSPYIKPLLQSSDAHDLNQIGGKYTWIKSDTTFEGLHQIIFEPENRVSISTEKPETKSPYLVIDHVEFSQSNATNTETTKLFFNPNLNTVIGGRSNGKSTLTNSIAQCLNNKLFIPQDPHSGRGMYAFNNSNFNVYWQDGASINSDREVEFIPQDYMISLADKDEDRNNLIRSIVKTDESNYKKILNYEKSVQENKSIIRQLLEELETLNHQLANLRAPEGDKSGIEKQLRKIEAAIKEQSVQVNFSVESQKKYQQSYDNLKKQKNGKRLTELNLQDLASIKTKKIKLQLPLSGTDDSDYNKQLTDFLFTLEQEANHKWQKKLISIETEQNNHLECFKEAINKIHISSDYINGQKNLKNNQELDFLSKQQKDESEKLESFKKFQSKKEKLEAQKVEKQKQLLAIYKNFKQYRNNLKSTFKAKPADGKIEIAIEFSNVPFEHEIQYLRGRNTENDTFIGKFDEDHDTLIDTIFDERNLSFNNTGNKDTLVKDVLSRTWTNLNYILKYEDDYFSQMSQGKKAFVILTLILEFSQDKKPVIIDQPEDSLDNRSIYLELTQYLKSKKKERQIILVTHNPNVVVGADAENVIVANQNSSETPNKDGVQFSYINGSLENTFSNSTSKTVLESKGIREHVIEILEGGKEAFKERENKYTS
ncbi:TrlF family AAA-like ATPase [Levilactobacillus namurensis]|nr:DNA repair ATPase [Levilactobacillus namurensis]MCW3779650.1 DNA repair ATPase [Levilactobacillus namurensis]